jgi:hypothetical protein
MKTISMNYFLETTLETTAPIKKVKEFNPNIKFVKNSFYIENSFGHQERVYPKEFKEVKDLGLGFNTVDFFNRDFLKKIIKEGFLLTSFVKYEANIGKKQGYIMESIVELNDELSSLYDAEMQKKAEKYFSLM